MKLTPKQEDQLRQVCVGLSCIVHEFFIRIPNQYDIEFIRHDAAMTERINVKNIFYWDMTVGGTPKTYWVCEKCHLILHDHVHVYKIQEAAHLEAL